ncbi:MAG: signal recognition particle-docking protein FtsY [Acidimicrobiia bacterium]|nr:signal recognition particle-docking protein FtsY [Acidimicrobiia bacterium]
MVVDTTLIIVLIVAAVLVVGGGAFYTIRRRTQGQVTDRRKPSIEAPRNRSETASTALADRLAKTRASLGMRLRDALGSTDDDDLYGGLEEALIAADLGVATSTRIVERVKASSPATPDAARTALREELLATLEGQDRSIRRINTPAVIVVVGVNGVGKTTTIAKLAARLREDGTDSILAAADTFRAAADTQLRTWADRVGVEIITAASGSDPASVAHDAYQAAKIRKKGAVIVDTAGRLHSKTNLMAELTKIVRILEREAGSVDEVLLVLDATTGQNGLAQTKQFTDAVGVTGIVLTKMDGTAKGGIAIGVEHELGVPVKFIGVGEGIGDLIRFEPEEFVDALLADS